MSALIAQFEIPELPKTINEIGHSHWRVKQRETQKWKRLVVDQCALARITGLGLTKAKLTLTRHSTRSPDFDNLVISFKPVVDGLIMAGVIVNDSPDVLAGSSYHWDYARPGKGKITVVIEKV